MTTLRALLQCLVLLLAGALAFQATAQDSDPPGRVAYLNQKQGTLSMSPTGDDSWYDTIPNRPLTQGDRLWADNDARAEVYVDDTALRMGEQTHLAIDELSDQALRVTVQQGRLQLRVRSELDGQRIELGTGNLALVVRTPGDYRVLVDPATDSTQVMVAQGSATVHGENGQVQELGSRQQAVFFGRDLAPGGAPQALSADFEQWLAARNQAEEQSPSARYISREVPGYQQLDQHGQWQNEPEYGAVWYPSQVAPGWAPYSDGYWITVAPWGLTWVDRAPWGFAPFHYGRWKRFGPRWGWVPGHRQVRPVYSPALVAFVGGAPGASFTVRGGQPAVGWFPLAPGDRWRPGYRASDRYVERANRTAMATRDAPAYANRGLPNAVTVVPADRFGRGGPISRRDHVRPPDPRALTQARVLDRPPVPAASPGGGMGFAGRRSAAAPPAAIQARQQPEWRQRVEQGQREQRDQARSQERGAREQQDAQRRAMQDQQQQMQRQQQEQTRRQAEQQQENMQRQARQQQDQTRRQTEQQQERAQQQAERQSQQMQMRERQEQARRQGEQQQEQVRRQAEQQQAQRAAQMQAQQDQARRQAEQQQAHAQRQAQQEQMRRQADQQQQAQRAAQMQAQQHQQQEQMRRQMEQQQGHAQRQAQQQQEHMRRQAEQQARQQQQQQQQMQQQARQQQQQMQQQAEQQARQRDQQQRQAQGGGGQRQRGGPQWGDQQQRP